MSLHYYYYYCYYYCYCYCYYRVCTFHLSCLFLQSKLVFVLQLVHLLQRRSK